MTTEKKPNFFDQFEPSEEEPNFFDQFEPQAPTAAQQEPTIGGFAKENILRPIAQAAQALSVGTLGTAGDIAQLVTNPALNLAAKGLKGAGFEGAARAVTPSGRTVSQDIRKTFDVATGGLTKPRGAGERIGQTAAETLSSGGLFGAAGKLGGAIARLAPKTAGELAALGTAGAGGGIAEEVAPGSVTAQLAGTLAGGLAPSIPNLLKKSISSAARIDPQAVKELTKVGVSPTVGMAGGAGAKILERTLADAPFSASIIRKASHNAVNQISSKVTSLADDLSTAATKQEAGAIIQKGARGFVSRFQDKSKQLFDNLKKVVPDQEPVQVSKTLAFLNDRISQFSGAPNITASLINPSIRKLAAALSIDAKDGKLPFRLLRNLRSDIGRKLSNPSIIDDIPRGELKRLYGSITEDIKDAAIEKGGSSGLKSFNRANNFYRAGIKRIDDSIEKIAQSDTPEKAFRLATTGTRDGATKLRALKKSLKPEEFQALQSVVIRDMGKATAGTQLPGGELFSVGTFLTNWNKFSPEAKNVLFSTTKDAKLRRGLDDLLNASNRIKQAEKMANTSGTARQLITCGVGVVAGRNLIKGVALLGGVRGTAKLMTNANFVNWLGKSVDLKTNKQLTSHMDKLSAMAISNPEIREDINQYLNVLKEAE